MSFSNTTLDVNPEDIGCNEISEIRGKHPCRLWGWSSFSTSTSTSDISIYFAAWIPLTGLLSACLVGWLAYWANSKTDFEWLTSLSVLPSVRNRAKLNKSPLITL